MADFDINKVQGNDRFIAGGGVLLFILSFFPWYSVSGFGGSNSISLWSAYGILKLALLLAIAASAVVIARLMGALDSVQLPAGVNLITLAASGLATVIFVLRLLGSFDSAGSGAIKISAHPGFGWWLGILVSGAMTYFAFLNFKTSGEQLPTKPGSATPPAPPVYPAPPTAPVRPQSPAPPTEAITPPPPPPNQPPGYPPTAP